MLQTVIKIFNIIEFTLLIAAILGVTYDFCRATFSARFASSNL